MLPFGCSLACLLLFYPALASSQGSISFTQPTSCTTTEFFNTASLQCSTCGGASLVKSADGLKCTCINGYTEADYGSPVVTCTQCMGIISFDRRLCLRCLNASCSCGVDQVREENLVAKTAACVTCVNPTFPNAVNDRCVLCQQTFTDASDTTCQCQTANVVGGLCLKSVGTETGSTLWENTFLQSSFQACNSYQNATACQLLTNMVVMNVFSFSNDAFKLQQSITDSISYVPSLFYTTAGTSLGASAPTNLSFQRNSKIQLKVVKYDARGNFLGWKDVAGGTLQLCPDTQSILDAAYVFGTSYNQSCTMQVSDLLQSIPEPVFYQLFLQYNDASGKVILWPIPVQNANIQSSRALRRFFLVDGLSGRTGNLANKPTTVTVATSLVLSIYLPMPTSSPATQPPFLLTVNYAKLNNNTSAQVSFAVSYSQGQGNYKRDTDISLGVLGSVAALYAILETSSWVRRSRPPNIELTVVIQFLAFLAGSLGNAFFLVTYGTAVYWLIAFKGQRSTVDVTLPPAGGQVETDFIIHLACAFALKALELIHLLVTQLTISIFLIDWEKPKDRPATNAERGKPSVSIWRTFLVANEWNEIQTHRKLSPTLQLFAVLLLLEVVGIKNIAAKDLNLDVNPADGSYLATWSIILRFGISVSIWLAVGLVQIIFVVGIYERFVEDKMHQFVDLCSISNVSVFILMHRCYGFYIHGRSVHGQADVNMETMLSHLKKEEENLCPLRGLEPNSEIQTFEVLLSDRVRLQYEKIMQPLLERPSGLKARIEGNPLLEQRIKTYYTFNRFLSSFLEHVYKDMDYIVKDKLFLERILSMEFQQPMEQSILYNDDSALFSKTLFYGNELVLLLFDTLLFSVIDLGTHNFVLATIITYIVQKLVEILRSTIGRKNLSMQTMVEEQFLI